MSEKDLIERATREGKWLFCQYQGLWWSPAELAQCNANGRFLWGAINFELRDPAELLAACEQRVVQAMAEVESVKARMAGTKVCGPSS